MIRCDIHKGKLRLGNFIEPGRDAQPRKDEGFVIDHGNIGKKIYFFKNIDFTKRGKSGIQPVGLFVLVEKFLG